MSAGFADVFALCGVWLGGGVPVDDDGVGPAHGGTGKKYPRRFSEEDYRRDEEKHARARREREQQERAEENRVAEAEREAEDAQAVDAERIARLAAQAQEIRRAEIATAAALAKFNATVAESVEAHILEERELDTIMFMMLVVAS